MLQADMWFFIVPTCAFFIQWFKTMLGMGWGTVLSPVLLSFGYDREEVVVSLLLVEFITSVGSSLFHFLMSNVFLSKNKENKETAAKTVPMQTLVSDAEGGDVKMSGDEVDPKLVPEVVSSDAEGETKIVNDTEGEGVTSDQELEGEGKSKKWKNIFHRKKKAKKEKPPPPTPEERIAKLRAEKPTEWYKLILWYYHLLCAYVDKYLSFDIRCIMLLGFIGGLGAVLSTFVTIYATDDKFKFGIKLYIGIVVFLMGVFTLVTFIFKPKFKFAWWKIVIISLWTGFNKGISGGGSGPIAVTGQMMSGRDHKNSIAVTPFSEIIVCSVGCICHFVSNMILCKQDDKTDHECWEEEKEFYTLVPYLLVGAVLSIPCAAMSTSKVKPAPLHIGVGIFTLLLGIFSITQSVLSWEGYWPKIKH